MKEALDRTDFEILAALQKNGRLSNKELAAEVGLAASTCLVRVQNLIRRRVIRGQTVDIDPRALGIGLMALIAVKLKDHHRATVERFREHLNQLPEAVTIYHQAGDVDFLVHLALRDADHLRLVVMNAFTEREEVEHMTTSILFDYQHQSLPNYQV